MKNWGSALNTKDMIEQHVARFDPGLTLFTYPTDTLFQSLLKQRKEHLPALFRTPNHMIMAGLEQVPVALVSLAHTIQYTSIGCLLSRTFVLSIPGILLLPSPNKERALLTHHRRGRFASSPLLKHGGFRARGLVR